MPDAKRDMFSSKMAVKTAGKKMMFIPDTAFLGREEKSVKFTRFVQGYYAGTFSMPTSYQ